MSDVMLLGVLRMPPTIWNDDAIDVAQRYSRYLEAANRIENDELKILELEDRLRASVLLNTVLLTSILLNSNDCHSSSSSDSS